MRRNHDKKQKWTLWTFDNAPKKRKKFPAIFYYLGKRRSKLKRKKFKWKISLENIITSERDSDSIKKRNRFKSIKKFSRFPALQMQHFLSFKVYLLLQRLSKNLLLSSQKQLFKIKILSLIIYINLFIKNFTSTKKNKATVRLLDSFLGKTLRYKRKGRITKKFKFPKCKVFFDYFSYIKGLNDEFVASRGKFGEIVTIKRKSSNIALKKYNTPWSSFFNIGLFMPYSYKRLVRRLFTNFVIKKIRESEFFEVKQDKILLINYLVKFLVFDKKISEPEYTSKISTNTFFFLIEKL